MKESMQHFKMLIVALLSFALTLSNAQHSGFYAWNRTEPTIAEDYAGAWLVSKERLVGAESSIVGGSRIEHGCFGVLRQTCPNCETFFSRDYFDFMVEHLTSTTNLFPVQSDDLFNVTSNRLSVTIGKLKKQRRISPDLRARSTLAMIVYSSISSSTKASENQVRIRHLFLQATYYSILRYFPRIVIVTADAADVAVIQRLGLPVQDVIVLEVPLKRMQTEQLPRDALMNVLQRLKSDAAWQWVKYLYYSEGDILLHLRSIKPLFNVIDKSNGSYALVPHRMQVSF